MRLALIKSSERELLDKIEFSVEDESSLWKIPNLLIPIGIIAITLLTFLAFHVQRFQPIRYFDLILNGSLPLIAINQISAIGINIFKFNKRKEEHFGINETAPLRTKLLYMSGCILILSWLLFAFQVINHPIRNNLLICIVFIISGILVIFSSYVSKKIFLLQEVFIDKTFESEIRQDIEEKGHGKNW